MRIDVEKLARALAERFYDDDIWDGMPSIVQGNWSHVAKKASALVLEEAAKALSDHDKTGREWVRGSLWDTLTNEGCARIRALAEGVR